MRNLPMTESEIRMRYRDGTSVQILADLNACTVSKIREILGTELKSIHPDKIAAPKPKQIRNRNIDWGKAKELYDEGMIDREIAVAVGASSPGVCTWRRKNGYSANCSKADAGRRSQRSPKREFPKQDQPIANETTQTTNETTQTTNETTQTTNETTQTTNETTQTTNETTQTTNDTPIIAHEPDCIVVAGSLAPLYLSADDMSAGVFHEDYPGKTATGKPRLSLVPPEIIEAVGRVRTYGAEKYGSPDNWLHVDPGLFKDALMRHICDYLRDPLSVDEESGLPHLEHIACNVAFLLALPERRNLS